MLRREPPPVSLRPHRALCWSFCLEPSEPCQSVLLLRRWTVRQFDVLDDFAHLVHGFAVEAASYGSSLRPWR